MLFRSSSLARTFGPVLFGWVFGRGLDEGIVGLAWWILAVVGVANCVAARFVREGDGHEVLMAGERKGEDGIVVRAENSTHRFADVPPR